MPATYKFIDPMRKLGVVEPFSVNDEGLSIFVCLRLLCGTINVERKETGRVVRLRQCFLTERERKLTRRSLSDIIATAFGGAYSPEDIQRYLRESRRRNSDFWASLAAELCHALICRERAQYLACFLHLYRLVEMTSVALPLFYASAEHNYKKALDFLKMLPENPRDGDLAIFRKFISEVSRAGGYGRHRIVFSYSRGNLRWDAAFEQQVNDYVIQAAGLNASVEVAAKQIEVPFVEMPSFIACFRNRMFHNALSAENFDLDRLNGPELVCEPLVDPILNWYTLVLCVIVEESISKHLVRG